MNITLFRAVVIIANIVTLMSSALMIITTTSPYMFMVTISRPPNSYTAYFGAFFWYDGYHYQLYERVTVGFRFIQVIFVFATLAAYVSSFVALVGYLKKEYKKPAGIFVLGSCNIDIGFSHTSGNIFVCIYVPAFIKTLTINSETLTPGRFLSFVWTVTALYASLGAMVRVHKFDDQEKTLL
ncbi:hypothetical protein RF11_06961 [Thelohanellus kitauei]|uniref:Uncharacterized protein n=1 Tax=Thelohanellus kitauei TaxID=669202 RepID=A0A0C2IYN3_THEKT|nr:hypothetical protein RF11_06961 [Thelohanellus kitauei]